MNTVCKLCQPRLFTGRYRVTSARTQYTRAGNKYLRIKLGDTSGSITAFAWEGQYAGPWKLESFDIIEVAGRSRFRNGIWVADIRRAETLTGQIENSVLLLPRSHSQTPEHIDRLVRVTAEVESIPLKRFLDHVFADMSIMAPFLSVQGSLKHHHSERGGLLRHSIEAAEIAAGVPQMSSERRDLAIVASLLHDIGKIRSYSMHGYSDHGFLVDHQAVTLEVLATQLASLEAEWPDGALALRHVLTCRSIKRWGYEPRMAIAHVVQLADRLSVEMDMEQNAFASLPGSRNVSVKLNGRNSSYWRPSPEPINNHQINVL